MSPEDRAGLFRAFIANASEAVVVMDEQGRILDWNPQAETIFGWPFSEVVGKPVVKLIIPERHRDAHRKGIERFRATGEGPVLGKRIEIEALRRDGSELTVELEVIPHKASSGWVFCGFIRDITQQRRIEESLRASERKFQDFYDNAPDMYLSTRTRTNEIVECNATCTRLLGFSKEEIIGRSIFDLYHPSCLEEAELAATHLLDHGEVHDVELSVRAKDGTKIQVSASATALRDPLGRISRARVVLRDITERKRLAELRSQSQELREEHRRAQEASRLKGEFLANMSHELRTPLNAILGFTELIRDGKVGPINDTQKEFMGDILSSGKHLLTLINDVLDLSKIEAGKMTFRPEALELQLVIREVADILRELAAKKKIKLTHDIEELEGIHLDPSKLKQVLYNYLSNAIKFTDEGGSVTVRARADGPEYFRIEVQDTGIGIAPEDIDRLFVEFQQLDGGTSKRHGGTGLGLALTKRIVTTQGGRVGVESTPGKGSTFYAVLPRRYG
jgi:PAS domain S-box-containing protein